MPAVSARLNANAADLMERIPKAGPLRAQKHRALLRRLIKALDRRITIDGADIQETKEGVHIRIHAMDWDQPWAVHLVGTSARISPGTINNRVPTIGGLRIDAEPPPLLALAEATLQYIYVKCVFTYTIENQAGRDVVTGITLPPGSVTMLASTLSASQLDDPENGAFHLLIATVGVSGAILSHPQTRSLSADFTINVPELGVLVQFV